MAFREPIFPEPFNLFEAPLCKLDLIPVPDHSLNEFIAEGINGAHLSKGRHGAA